jgi:molybdopterin-containing oxidoreductase family membrane subunit
VITWTIVFCNTVAPQILWFRAMRRNRAVLLIVSVLVLIGMWFERYMIILTSLHRDFLPSSWGMFRPTIWDYLTYFSSIGLFLTCFLLFLRFLPMISISEMRALLPGAQSAGVGR